jgi:glucose/arabinose dehydrogenase
VIPKRNIRGRRLPALGFLILAAILSVQGCSKKDDKTINPNPTPPPGPTDLGLRLIQDGFSFPTYVAAAPGDTSRLFVCEKGGVIRLVKNGTLLTTPFLDVSGLVSTGDEEGLLSIVFEPSYTSTGRFYICYTNTAGDPVIARYLRSADPDVAESSPQAIILTVDMPDEVNHKGGMLAFGPDGYLWASFGDGGGQNDPRGYGQTKNDLMGSLIRIDVSGNSGYQVPSTNPFTAPARAELWDFGFRNPWRFSFDRLTGDLYIGEVGQDSHEEVNVGLAGIGARGRGANYGWSITEGTSCFNPSSGCDKTGITMPVLTYDHGVGCAVIGGYVYRGIAIPGLQGTYFYGDHCNGWIKSFRLAGGVATQQTDWASLDTNGNITSFGEDSRGEIYVATEGGSVYKIVAQ